MVKYSKALHDLLRDGSAEAFHDEVQALLDEIERLQAELSKKIEQLPEQTWLDVTGIEQQPIKIYGTFTGKNEPPFRKSYTREGIENQFQADQ